MNEYNAGGNDAYELDWEEEFQSSDEYLLLKEGDYNFTVIKFERGRFPGGQKIPECKKVILTLAVNTPEGTANVKYDLIMWSTLSFRIKNFLVSIGQVNREDKTIKPRWNDVIGCQGRAHFKPREYTVNNEKRETNDVEKFYDYDPKFFSSAPRSTQPATGAANKPRWSAGKF